jgi:hypothetical protein
VMRFLFRVVILGLAAFGAKALYDRFAPPIARARGPASDVVDSARDAGMRVADHARSAATEVVEDAREQAMRLQEEATQAVNVATQTPDSQPRPT